MKTFKEVWEEFLKKNNNDIQWKTGAQIGEALFHSRDTDIEAFKTTLEIFKTERDLYKDKCEALQKENEQLKNKINKIVSIVDNLDNWGFVEISDHEHETTIVKNILDNILKENNNVKG